MRKPEYLSPTAISEFLKSEDEYYAKYLADNRPPRFAQTKEMAVGSAFDCYAKSYLHKAIFGGSNPEYDFDALFERAVEIQNRDLARKDGMHVFECYANSGCLADLLLELSQANQTPRFEIEIRGDADPGKKLSTLDVVLLGKPDLYYTHKQGARIVVDWKVNGYYAQRTTSPMQGYIRLRDGWRGLQSRNHNCPHKDAFLHQHKGVTINSAICLEKGNPDWARQLSIYSWLCGEEIGSDFVVGIDQIVGKPTMALPELRVAEHRLCISKEFQMQTYATIVDLWERIQTGYFFTKMSREDSDARCKILDQQGAAYAPDAPHAEYLNQLRQEQQRKY